jgi:hypothetical protein
MHIILSSSYSSGLLLVLLSVVLCDFLSVSLSFSLFLLLSPLLLLYKLTFLRLHSKFDFNTNVTMFSSFSVPSICERSLSKGSTPHWRYVLEPTLDSGTPPTQISGQASTTIKRDFGSFTDWSMISVTSDWHFIEDSGPCSWLVL